MLPSERRWQTPRKQWPMPILSWRGCRRGGRDEHHQNQCHEQEHTLKNPRHRTLPWCPIRIATTPKANMPSTETIGGSGWTSTGCSYCWLLLYSAHIFWQCEGPHDHLVCCRLLGSNQTRSLCQVRKIASVNDKWTGLFLLNGYYVVACCG